MKKQQLKSIILNQNELLNNWRQSSENMEHLRDQMERLLGICENANAEISEENQRLKEQIGEIREYQNDDSCRHKKPLIDCQEARSNQDRYIKELKSRIREIEGNKDEVPTYKERFLDAAKEVRGLSSEIYELKKENKHLTDQAACPRKSMSPKVDYDLGVLAKTFRRLRRDYDGNEPLSYNLIIHIIGILESLGYSEE